MYDTKILKYYLYYYYFFKGSVMILLSAGYCSIQATMKHTWSTSRPPFCFFIESMPSRKGLWVMWDTKVHLPWGLASSLAYFRLEIRP